MAALMKKILAADLFCGAGGASTGFIRACDEVGLDYDLLAVNHWTTAVKTHALNHPGVRHLCESIERVDPREQFPGGRLHLLLAGPECTHFSTARGGRPVNPQSRASAWHIAKWAQELYIDTLLIENVPEFRTWGPVGADGHPLKSKRGETFNAFLKVLESLGYRVEVKILNAADYGDPTTRQRLFIMARRGKHAIRWPEPTHSKTGDSTLFGGRQRWAAARQVIDWNIQGKSIFNRKKPLRPATIARIIAGLEKFGGDELKPFLVVLRNNQNAQSVEGPVPTLTTSGANVGLAQPCLVAMEHGGRSLDVDRPLPTITTAKGGAFGVAEPIVMPVTHGHDAGRVRSVGDPLPTVTGANRGELAVAQAFVISAGGPTCPARPVDEPLGTVLTRDHRALVEAFVLGQQSGSVARSVGEPMPTIATDGAIAIVEPCLVQTNERRAERVASVDDPLRTITAVGGRCFGLAEPFLVPMYGEREGQAPRTHSIDQPVPVIPATGGGKFGVVEPVIVDAAFGRGDDTRRAKSLDDPLGTIPGSNRFAVVEPFLTKFYGTATGAQSVDEPLDTLTAKDRMAIAEAFVLQQQSNGAPRSTQDPLPTIATAGKQALVEPFLFANRTHNAPKSLDEPVPALCTGDHIALVQPVVNGYALDIHFRMLQPHELAAAMSFPKTYQFTGTREEVVKQIGNSWAGELSKALCVAAIHDFAPKRHPQTWKGQAIA
jgi:DNA (cytosine-5)-methyltransferase 1